MREGWDIPLDGCCSLYSLSEMKYKIKERGEAATVAVVLRCCCCCRRRHRCRCCCHRRSCHRRRRRCRCCRHRRSCCRCFAFAIWICFSRAPASSHSHLLPPLVLLQPPLGLGFVPNSTRHWPGES